MIPFTRMIVGTSIGLQAAIVPLTVGAAPFIARMVENALLEIPSGLVEAARAMGATPTPMGWSEVYTALQQKVIDGVEAQHPALRLAAPVAERVRPGDRHLGPAAGRRAQVDDARPAPDEASPSQSRYHHPSRARPRSADR